MRQAQAIWLIIEIQGIGIKLKKVRKTFEMKLQLDVYKGFLREMATIKFKRSMKHLLKDMVRLKGLP